MVKYKVCDNLETCIYCVEKSELKTPKVTGLIKWYSIIDPMRGKLRDLINTKVMFLDLDDTSSKVLDELDTKEHSSLYPVCFKIKKI